MYSVVNSQVGLYNFSKVVNFIIKDFGFGLLFGIGFVFGGFC